MSPHAQSQTGPEDAPADPDRAPTPPLPRGRAWLAPLLLVASLGATLGAYGGARYIGLARLDSEIDDRLTITRHAVFTEIERYRYLPDVAGRDARIRALLSLGPDLSREASANAYLQTVRDISGADELYLLTRDGRTIASSNWNTPGSFVGQNYAFRPYFNQALQTGEGRYFAVGVTTGKPGYFLAARIGTRAHPLGVAVVKVDMSALEGTWVRAAEPVAVADADGIVFLSGQNSWKYRPLKPLSTATLAQLNQERRYEGLAVETASPLLVQGPLLADDHAAMRYGMRDLSPDGWRILAGLPEAPVIWMARLVAGLTALAGALFSGAVLLLSQRRQITRMRLEQADILEARVAERTEALAREVEERRRAEDELRRTHESLVHAAKLAVLGRMSSAIVHEVSQPLSALDATLAAGDLHLERGDGARAQRSLASARELVRRMQDMVRALRRFAARRRPEPLQPVALPAALEGALELLAPRLRELAIAVRPDLPPDLPDIAGHPVQLQQVLANLILNAAEATHGLDPQDRSGRAAITLAARVEAGRLCLEIADRGPGIPEALRDKVEEPFFTTRQTGEGLGLGLAITRTILDHMGATLELAPRPGGGTLARLDLALFDPSAAGAAAPPRSDTRKDAP